MMAKIRNLAVATTMTLALLAVAVTAHGATYIVKPDGTGDFPVIQAAIDGASNGDEILLTDGIFKGMGNKQVYFWGKAVTVRSQSGNREACIIDAEGSIGLPTTVFLFENGEGPGSVVRDLSIINGSSATSC